jgi:Uma2 family endonuclease
MKAMGYPKDLSVADYLAGEEHSDVKHEYLGGTVHAMAGATNQHNTIAVNALIAIGGQLRGKSCQPFNSDTKVRIEFPDHTRFYYPDAMVVCHPNPLSDHFQNQPVVVIEILSESTRRADLGEKRDAYLTLPSLKVLILAESDHPSATIYRRKPEGGFGVERASGPGAVIPLPEIDAELPFAELYRRTGIASTEA